MSRYSILILIFQLYQLPISAGAIDGQIKDCRVILISEFVEKSYFKTAMSLLNQEDRFDTLDALMHKSLSSNSFVSFEQTPDSVIKEKGKIEENNIVLALSYIEGIEKKIFIITQYLGYCHVFIYNLDQNMLHRVSNKGPTVKTRIDFLRFNGFDATSMYFISEIFDEPGDKIVRKHFKYDSGEFYHFMNCIIENDEEDCKKVEIDYSFLKRLYN